MVYLMLRNGVIISTDTGHWHKLLDVIIRSYSIPLANLESKTNTCSSSIGLHLKRGTVFNTRFYLRNWIAVLEIQVWHPDLKMRLDMNAEVTDYRIENLEVYNKACLLLFNKLSNRILISLLRCTDKGTFTPFKKHYSIARYTLHKSSTFDVVGIYESKEELVTHLITP